MADSKDTEINIKITGDDSELRKTFKQSANFFKQQQKTALGGDKKQLQVDKKRQKLLKDKKRVKGTQQKELQHAKRLQKIQRQRTKDLQQQTKELEKQSRIQRRLERGGGGGLFGGGGRGRGGGRGGRGRGLGMLRGIPGIGRYLAGGLGGLALGAGALASMPIGMGVGMLRKGHGEYSNYNRATVGLSPMMNYSSSRNNRLAGNAANMAYGASEAAQHAIQLGRSTGARGNQLLRSTDVAQRLSRVGSMGVGEVSSAAGALTRGGMDVASSPKGRQNLIRIFRDAVSAGLDRSRTGEHMGAVTSLVANAGGVLGGSVSGGGISSLMARIGQGGAGLQGARGASVLGKFDSAVKSGGGSEASKAFMMRAFGFGNIGGSQSSYYDALKAQQTGILGADDPTETFRKIFDQAMSEAGGDRKTAILRMSKSGMGSIDVLERLLSAFETGNLDDVAEAEQAKKRALPDLIAESNEIMSSGFSKIAKQDAELAAKRIASGEKLADAVLDFQRALHDLTEKVLPGLIKLINVVLEVVSGLMERLEPLFTKISDVLGYLGQWMADLFGGSNAMDYNFSARTSSAARGKGSYNAFKSASQDAGQMGDYLKYMKHAASDSTYESVGADSLWTTLSMAKKHDPAQLVNTMDRMQGALDALTPSELSAKRTEYDELLAVLGEFSKAYMKAKSTPPASAPPVPGGDAANDTQGSTTPTSGGTGSSTANQI